MASLLQRRALTRENEEDVAAALEGLVWVESVHVLDLGPRAQLDENPLDFAVVLAPYAIDSLVQTHYALVSATGGRELPGRVLYVDAGMPPPVPLRRGRRLVVGPVERARARLRIGERRARTPGLASDAAGISDVFRDHVLRAFEDARDPTVNDAPFRIALGPAPNEAERRARVERHLAGRSLTVGFAGGRLEVVAVAPDPFPSPRRASIVVADEDPSTARILRASPEFEVVHVDEGWAAVDHLTGGTFDGAVCALRLGDLTGAQIHRLVAKTRPDMAARIFLLASESVVAEAAPCSASARVLARPLDVSVLRHRLGIVAL